jgi:tetratricopeptide (TPR) repeat protein
MEARQILMQATKLWREAYRYQIKGKLDRAIELFRQAKCYEPRQLSFMNLGRIYVRQGRWWQALRGLEGAVRLAPRDLRAARILHSLRARLS